MVGSSDYYFIDHTETLKSAKKAELNMNPQLAGSNFYFMDPTHNVQTHIKNDEKPHQIDGDFESISSARRDYLIHLLNLEFQKFTEENGLDFLDDSDEEIQDFL